MVKRESASERVDVRTLYDRYAPMLLGVCRRYCETLEDAEDVLHDGFMKIIKALPAFEPRREGSLEAWMKRIMVNTSLNHLRSRAKDNRLVPLEDWHDKTILEEEEGDSLMEGLSEVIDKERILQMVTGLPSGYRAVFNLFVFESYSHREIAEALGCTESTSKSQLSKARALLRRQLTVIINQQLVNQ